MPPPPSSDPEPRSRDGVAARLRRKGWAVGLTGVTVVVILLLFGAMSATAGDPMLAQAQRAQSPFAKTALPSSTPAPAQTFTPTPGQGTPTVGPRVSCPTVGCPYSLTPVPGATWYPIYIGQDPGNGSQQKPVLLFVHGLTGVASDWWSQTAVSGVNDMYLMAYNAGYRTAFVTLQPGGGVGPDANEYTNGPILASQILTILGYFRVGGVSPRIDIIAHSKGGIDTQAALWLGNASMYQYVDNFFMLSTPNTGSQLATIECTPQVNNVSAICSLDPGNMTIFRGNVDPNITKHPIPMYVSGGTDHGPAGSLLDFGGTYLQQFGSNDGFVTEKSAVSLTPSTYMFVHSVNHDGIRVGHVAFPYILSILEEGTPVSSGSKAAAARQSPSAP